MKIPQLFMVVDDDRTNNMICEFALRRFSSIPAIKTFIDPEVALQCIKDSYSVQEINISTVLFLDINMPVMTGWDFLDVFKDFSQEIKQQFIIYILSSSIDERDKEKAETDPLVKGFLSKPLSAEIIRAIFSPHNISDQSEPRLS